MTQRTAKFLNKYRLFILCSILFCILIATPTFLYAAPMNATHLHHAHENHHPSGRFRCKSYHTVQMGEGLYKIARQYHVNIHILAQANGITDIHHVKAWDTLCIPDVVVPQKNTPISPFPTVQPPTPTNSLPYPRTTPMLPPSTMPSDNQTITISQTSGNVTIVQGDNNIVTHGCNCVPTVTPTSMPSPILTLIHTATHAPTVTPSVTATPSPPPTQTATNVPSPTQTPTLTPTSSPTLTPTSSPTLTPTPSPTLTSTPSPTPTVHLSHWHGEYFNNGSLIGMPLYIQHDAVINFDWQQLSPTDLPHDQFSVRWTQLAYFDEGVYIFKVIADDGIIVRLDNEIILDGWRDQPATEYTENITLTAGFHEVQVDYYERYGDALIYVNWGKIEG